MSIVDLAALFGFAASAAGALFFVYYRGRGDERQDRAFVALAMGAGALFIVWIVRNPSMGEWVIVRVGLAVAGIILGVLGVVKASIKKR